MREDAVAVLRCHLAQQRGHRSQSGGGVPLTPHRTHQDAPDTPQPSLLLRSVGRSSGLQNNLWTGLSCERTNEGREEERLLAIDHGLTIAFCGVRRAAPPTQSQGASWK